MVEKITEIDVTCRDVSSDPIVERVWTQTLGVVLLTDDEAAEALGFSYLPGITKLSEIIAHGWVKPEKNPIPNYQGGGLPAWKLVRE